MGFQKLQNFWVVKKVNEIYIICKILIFFKLAHFTQKVSNKLDRARIPWDS